MAGPTSFSNTGIAGRFAFDLRGFLMAFLVFVEVIFAYQERSSNTHGADARPASVIIGPAPVQQHPVYQYPYNPAQPVQQYVYAPVVQPGQPVVYFPQPVMTAKSHSMHLSINPTLLQRSRVTRSRQPLPLQHQKKSRN